MFAPRSHNENAIHAHQTAAAAKPLNQGLKGLAPKTPGNKLPKNDENAAIQPGKTGGGKGGKEGGGLKGEGWGFVTPAGPRTARAPLGNKTTNARATTFRTPFAAEPPTEQKLSAKPTSPRMRRSKVKIHQADVEPLAGNEVVEREVEYMPPRGVPLPDIPDDDGLDALGPLDRRSFPQFEGGNLTRGWMAEFASGGDEGESGEELSDFETKVREVEERERKAAAKAKARARARGEVGKKPLASTTKTTTTTRLPSTLSSRTAASALSSTRKHPSSTATPNFAAPTAAAKARLPSSALASKKPTPAGNARHTAAKAASNTTLGYSRGRVVSGAAHRPLTVLKSYEPEMGKYEVLKKKPSPSEMREVLGLGIGRLVLAEGGEGEDQEAEDGVLAGGLVNEVEDEFADFQLEAA